MSWLALVLIGAAVEYADPVQAHGAILCLLAVFGWAVFSPVYEGLRA